MKLPRERLNSSSIESVVYDPDTLDLEVTFSSGGSYTYPDVSPSTYQALLAAPSPGRYFHDAIRRS